MTAEELEIALTEIIDICNIEDMYGRFGRKRFYLSDNRVIEIDSDLEASDFYDNEKIAKLALPDLSFMFVPYDKIVSIELYVPKESKDNWFNNPDIYHINTLTKEIIISRLANAVSGTHATLYTEQEIDKFAEFYTDKWDENTSEDVIAEAFVDFWWLTKRPCRRCSECGKLMQAGYCINMGDAFYCTDDCLHAHFTEEEWLKECEENDQSYWTELY